MVPSFYYRVDNLASTQPRHERNRLRPSRRTTGHTIVNSPWPSQQAYYFDGSAKRSTTQRYSIDATAPTQCYSLYRDLESHVWIVDHDVTQTATGCGRDTQSVAEEDEPNTHDWSRLKFGRCETPVPCSVAGYGQEHDHLQYKTIGSTPSWMTHLLPPKCHDGPSTSLSETSHGLSGDLALLIGLLCLADGSTRSVKNRLPSFLRERWLHPTAHAYHETNRSDCLTGVLVKLWLARSSPLEQHQQAGQFAASNTIERLQQYQSGAMGPIIFDW